MTSRLRGFRTSQNVKSPNTIANAEIRMTILLAFIDLLMNSAKFKRTVPVGNSAPVVVRHHTIYGVVLADFIPSAPGPIAASQSAAWYDRFYIDLLEAVGESRQAVSPCAIRRPLATAINSLTLWARTATATPLRTLKGDPYASLRIPLY